MGYISPWCCKEPDMAEQLHFHRGPHLILRYLSNQMRNPLNLVSKEAPGASTTVLTYSNWYVPVFHQYLPKFLP